MSNEKPSLDPDEQRHDDDLFTDVAANPELARVAFILTSHPSDRELSGLNAAILDFRAARVAAPTPKPRRRPSMISSLAGAKLGATIAGIAVGLGGAATVAYVSTSTNVTPNSHATAAATPTQSASATETESADSTKSADSTAAPVGPDATGAAAYGLCTAWKNVADSGKAMGAVAFKNLATAAGGKDKIEAFCATVKAPGKSADHATGKPADATGKPATPTAKAGEHTGTPESTGKPTTIPTVPDTHPTGRS